MALAPKRITTRQVALIRELGIDESIVVEFGLDENGIEVLGAFPERGTVRYVGGNFIRTTIEWVDDETRQRGLAARRADWLESVGLSEREWAEQEERLRHAVSTND